MEAKNSSRGLLPWCAGLALVMELVLATTVLAQHAVPDPPSTQVFQQQQIPQPVKPLPQIPEPARPLAPALDRQGRPAANGAANGTESEGRAGPKSKELPAPALEHGEEGLKINLATALKLANVRAWDIMIAIDQLRIAAAQLQGADVLWLPTIQMGVDYQYHSGPIQTVPGPVIKADRSSLYVGAAPLALFAVTDAIFEPLAQRQVVRAEAANIQTSRNDTLTDLSQVYFNLLEAEADMAGVLDVDRQATELVKKAEGLAPGLIPDVELARVRTSKANFEQVVETARQRWRDASAEVARVIRIRPTVVLQPLEPPQLRITLIPLPPRPDDLIPLALANRPELTFEEAQAEAAAERLRQEKWRPFLPIMIARGGGTVPPDALAVGLYGAGPNGDMNHFGLRSDWDVGAYWEWRNLGFGNVALIRQRRAEYELARHQEYRFRDLVMREVTQAWADVRSAGQRVQEVGRELRQAELSARENLEGLGEVKRVAGGLNILVIRPLEVVAAQQALLAAYLDYFGVMADYNRAQFRLYRAVGSPAQALAGSKPVCQDAAKSPEATGPNAGKKWTLGLETNGSSSDNAADQGYKPEAPARPGREMLPPPRRDQPQ
jgi:outer membrane protein TolC